jgi:hypothetical protein
MLTSTRAVGVQQEYLEWKRKHRPLRVLLEAGTFTTVLADDTMKVGALTDMIGHSVDLSNAVDSFDIEDDENGSYQQPDVGSFSCSLSLFLVLFLLNVNKHISSLEFGEGAMHCNSSFLARVRSSPCLRSAPPRILNTLLFPIHPPPYRHAA